VSLDWGAGGPCTIIYTEAVDVLVSISLLIVITMLIKRYCPGGPDSDFEYSTQSYTGYEVGVFFTSWRASPDVQPTSMRAIRARYDPYEQTRGRVDQLRGLGHDVDKVEIMSVDIPPVV
jgi:hypothetical protein